MPQKSFLAILFLFHSSFLIGQKTTTITIHLNGTKEVKAFLQKDQETIATNISEGVFKFEIPLNMESFFDFGCGNNSCEIYLEPGDSLTLTADENDFDKTLQFTGNHKPENYYMYQRNLKRKIFAPILTSIRTYPEDAFLASLDSVVTAMENDFKNYRVVNKELSAKFIKYEKTNFAFIRVNQKSVFANNYATNHKDNSVLSSGFSNYLKTLEYNDASLLPSPRFRDFVRNIRYNETFKLLSRKPELADSTNDNIKAMFMIIDSLFKNQMIKNYSLYTTLRFELRQLGLAIPPDIISDFYKKCTDDSYVKEIKENYYIWTTLKKGNDAPVFTIIDLSGKQVSLKDFIGKYLYIDVWATWCVPCIREMPALDSLMYAYRDNDKIKFVKISIDANKTAWENKVKKEASSSAFTLWAENGAGSDFAKAYAIKDIPRYILINKMGKIIDAQALAPSLVKDQIEKILKTDK